MIRSDPKFDHDYFQITLGPRRLIMFQIDTNM